LKKEDFELTSADIEMDVVATQLDKVSTDMENNRPIKYTLVQIQGATFDLTVNVPDAQFDDILTKIEGFYDRMIKKCRYQEAIEEETDDVMVG